MVRFPTGLRHAPRPEYRTEAEPSDNTVSYEDLIKSASFSPSLSFLLAMMLKDGMERNKALTMLKEIEPYVSEGDKAAIQSILGAVQVSNDFRSSPADFQAPRVPPELSEFSKSSRQNTLIETMLKYGGRGSSSNMKNLQRIIEMQYEYERLLKRLQKIKNLNMNSNEDVFEAMSMLMSSEQLAELQNMQNMIKMMSNLKDIKPEDILNQMGGK